MEKSYINFLNHTQSLQLVSTNWKKTQIQTGFSQNILYLIFNKQFLVAIDSNISGLQRFTTLLEMVGLENRLFYTDRDDINKIDEIANQKIDYTIVNRIIEKHAKDSYKWLLNAIKGEKRYTMTAYDILLKRLDERIGDLENR